jgi:hypothetical protein
MPVAWSVTTAKGVTSLPVPEVVGMATNCASLPRGGMALMRLRMSCRAQERIAQAQHTHTPRYSNTTEPVRVTTPP